MTCEEAENRLAALLAGELPDEDRAALDAHLAVCAACRELQADWARDDAQLREGFAPWRAASETVAARTIRQLHREQLRPAAAPPTAVRAWPAFVGGLAAGFLLALLLWRPWTAAPEPRQQVVERAPATQSPMDVTPPTVVDKAVLASVVGNVEVLPTDGGEWTAAATGDELSLGCAIRTASDGLCEFHCPDGQTARLNVESEVKVGGANELELVRGQLWAGTPAGKEVRVRTPLAAVQADSGSVDIRQAEQETVVTAAAGNALVRFANQSQSLAAGEELVIADQRIARHDRAYSLALITAWMNPLLALKSPDDPELNAQVDALLAHLGETKMTLLSDAELRSLGPSCATPLARYVRSEDSLREAERRRHAARLLADLAPLSLAGELIELLADNDPMVRTSAATALRRITGLDMDYPIEHWRQAPDESQRAALEAWRAWWSANSFRCPPAPRATPAIDKRKT